MSQLSQKDYLKQKESYQNFLKWKNSEKGSKFDRIMAADKAEKEKRKLADQWLNDIRDKKKSKKPRPEFLPNTEKDDKEKAEELAAMGDDKAEPERTGKKFSKDGQAISNDFNPFKQQVGALDTIEQFNRTVTQMPLHGSGKKIKLYGDDPCNLHDESDITPSQKQRYDSYTKGGSQRHRGYGRDRFGNDRYRGERLDKFSNGGGGEGGDKYGGKFHNKYQKYHANSQGGKVRYQGKADDNVWRFNPNSEYNKLNSRLNEKDLQKVQAYYEDQRAFFPHRKALAENIERARRADPVKEAQMQQSEEIRVLAAEKRVENRKNYNEMKKALEATAKEGAPTTLQEEVILQEGKRRRIIFEFITLSLFSVSSNFLTPDAVIKLLQKHKAQYAKKKREWIVPFMNYKECVIEVTSFCRTRNIDVDTIPQSLFDLFEFKIPFSDDSKENVPGYNYQLDLIRKPRITQLPTKIQTSLLEFQKVGVQFGIDHHGRVLIGDEMGVGKTIQAIAISYLYRQDWPMVIICPSSLRLNWRDEILNWLPLIKEEEIQIFSSGYDDFLPAKKIYIVSYNIANRIAGSLIRRGFKVVVADEAHYLKSRESQRAKSLVPFLMQAKRCILLTGTPILARPVEIYNLLRMVRPDVFHSFHDFGLRYCNPKESYMGIDWNGSKNMRELHMMLENSFMIRRLKTDVLTQLPAKRRQRLSIRTDNNIVKKIHFMLKKVKGWSDAVGRKGENIFGALGNDFEAFVRSQTKEGKQSLLQDPNFNRLDDKHNYLVSAYNLTSQAKVKGVQEFVDMLLENRIKFIIFAHHYEMLDAIEESVVRKKVSHIRIDGKIETDKRHQAVRKFQTDTECLVAVLALTACCTGITLTAASTVVFAEMTWTHGIHVQAEDRAHRIGQVNSVNVYYLFGESTIDHMIYPRLKLKSEVFSSILDGRTEGNFRIENEEERSRRRMEAESKQQKLDNNLTKKYESISMKTKEQLEMAHGASSQSSEIRQQNIQEYFFACYRPAQEAELQQDYARSRFSRPGESENEPISLCVDNNDEEMASQTPKQSQPLAEQSQRIQKSLERKPGEVARIMEIDRQSSQVPSEVVIDENDNIMISNEPLDELMTQYDEDGEEVIDLPPPPLAKTASAKPKRIKVSTENWNEGINGKYRAFQKLREEKDKMFVENKIFKKFRSAFPGLKRCHIRAKQPNKLTEYETPTDPTKINRIIDDVDPASFFEKEYAQDDEKKRKEEDELYPEREGINPDAYKTDEVKVKSLQSETAPSPLESMHKLLGLKEEEGYEEKQEPEDPAVIKARLDRQLREKDPLSDLQRNMAKFQEERDAKYFSETIKVEQQQKARKAFLKSMANAADDFEDYFESGMWPYLILEEDGTPHPHNGFQLRIEPDTPASITHPVVLTSEEIEAYNRKYVDIVHWDDQRKKAEESKDEVEEASSLKVEKGEKIEKSEKVEKSEKPSEQTRDNTEAMVRSYIAEHENASQSEGTFPYLPESVDEPADGTQSQIAQAQVEETQATQLPPTQKTELPDSSQIGDFDGQKSQGLNLSQDTSEDPECFYDALIEGSLAGKKRALEVPCSDEEDSSEPPLKRKKPSEPGPLDSQIVMLDSQAEEAQAERQYFAQTQ